MVINVLPAADATALLGQAITMLPKITSALSTYMKSTVGRSGKVVVSVIIIIY